MFVKSKSSTDFFVSMWVISVMCSCVFSMSSANNVNLKLLKLRANIAQCRVSCLENFVVGIGPIKFNYNEAIINSGDNDDDNMGCTTKTNWKCNMCWDYCESLGVYERTRVQMCTDDICLDGCEQACAFYNVPQATLEPIISTLSPPLGKPQENVLKLKLSEPKVTKNGVVITWKIDLRSKKLVYVAMGAQSQSSPTTIWETWEEIEQTTARQLTLPAAAPKYSRIVIFAYDKNRYVQHDSKQLVNKLRVKRSLSSFATHSFSSKVETIPTIIGFVLLSLLSLIALVLIVFLTKKMCVKRQEQNELDIV